MEIQFKKILPISSPSKLDPPKSQPSKLQISGYKLFDAPWDVVSFGAEQKQEAFESWSVHVQMQNNFVLSEEYSK